MASPGGKTACAALPARNIEAFGTVNAKCHLHSTAKLFLTVGEKTGYILGGMGAGHVWVQLVA